MISCTRGRKLKEPATRSEFKIMNKNRSRAGCNLITLQQEIIKLTVFSGGLRASARGPARRFYFLLMSFVLFPSLSRGLDLFSRTCKKPTLGRRDAQTNAVSDVEGGHQARFSMLSSLVHCGGKRALAAVRPAFEELDPFRAAESVVKCASDGEETESGEARIGGEARVGGEAEAGVEVKAGGEAVFSGTGEAADARFKADRANAAIIEYDQGPGGAAEAGGVMGCLGEDLRGGWDAVAAERRGWVKVGGRASSRIFLQLLLVPPRLRTPCLSLRLRCTPIRFSDRPSTHPLTNPPSCPAPRLQTGASAMSSYGDREQQEGI